MKRTTTHFQLLLKEYAEQVAKAAENLAFVFENLGEEIVLDCSMGSLEKAEGVYWDLRERGEWPAIIDEKHYAHLLGQYLTQCILCSTQSKLIVCDERNMMYGQPCIQLGTGNKWDRVYPVQFAVGLPDLPRTNPTFLGLQKRRVAAAQFERALRIAPRAGPVSE